MSSRSSAAVGAPALGWRGLEQVPSQAADKIDFKGRNLADWHPIGNCQN